MKRFISSLFVLSLLTACGSATVQLNVSYKGTVDGARKAELSSAVGRIVAGRVLGMNGGGVSAEMTAEPEHRLISQKFEENASGGVLTLAISSPEAAEILKEQMMEPFTLHVLIQAEAGKGVFRHETYGEFMESGVIETHFDWATAAAVPNGKGSVTLTLTTEGQALLKQVLKENEGKLMAIFIRGRLMSISKIETADTRQVIHIDQIPSSNIAAVFADDVNVGLHMSFQAL